MATNYAQALGISNKWAPVVFAVVYFVITLYYISQAVRRHRSIYGGLAFFSAMRVAAYTLRALMANNSNDAMNKGMGIAYEVLYSVGFFSLLLSAYRLLQDRERLARLNRVGSRITHAVHKGHLVHLLLFLAVVLGTVGIIYALGNYGHEGLGNGLNSASTYIFAVVAIIIALLTLMLLRLERSLRGQSTAAPSVGATHHALILLVIAALLLLRTLFYAVTVHERLSGTSFTQTAQSNEKLWYPLAALAELLVALLFLLPGLVPLRSLLSGHHRNAGDEKNGYATGQEGYSNGQTGYGNNAV